MSARRKLGALLEWHNGSIRVVVSVPKHLQPLVGKTKLKEALGTDSPARAESLKHAVVAKLKAELDGVARVADSPLLREALSWKRQIAAAPLPEDEDDYDEPGVLSEHLEDRAREIERSHGPRAAEEFFFVALGKATPLKAHLETFLAEQTYSPRYKDDIRRAVGRLSTWSAKGGAPETLEAVTRKVAGEFISNGLRAVLHDPKTINKDISALASYWRWLGRRGHLADGSANPWERQGFEVRKSSGLGSHDKEREFTPDEAAALLHGPASPRMRDIMWIGALSGMRLDEICRLQVGDCSGGMFAVNARRGRTGEGKSDAARRDVPIHPELTAIVEARSKGKAQGALLIDGLPAPDPKGLRKPSAAAGQEFTRYRKVVGVDERIEGVRRGLVNFHSWRRWFVTEAERAGQPPHIISAVVGHAEGRKGMTLGTYSGGPSQAQYRAVVESVQPPPKPEDGGT